MKTFKVNFESGNAFRTGGAGLSAENQLPTDYSGGFTDPSAPPSRCGGRVALVIDTSGSVPAGNGDEATKDAAVGFIDGFTGTPTTMSINGFDHGGLRHDLGTSKPASTVAKAQSNGLRAPFVSFLNPGPTVDTIEEAQSPISTTSTGGLAGRWVRRVTAQRDRNGDR